MKLKLLFIVLFYQTSVFSQRCFLHNDTISFQKKSVLRNTGQSFERLTRTKLKSLLLKYESSKKQYKSFKNSYWLSNGSAVLVLVANGIINYHYSKSSNYFNQSKQRNTITILASVPLLTVMTIYSFRSISALKKAVKAYNKQKLKAVL